MPGRKDSGTDRVSDRPAGQLPIARHNAPQSCPDALLRGFAHCIGAGSSRLPQQLQAKLHLPADGLRSGQLAECGIPERQSRAQCRGERERRSVGQVESFATELKPRPLGNLEFLEQ